MNLLLRAAISAAASDREKFVDRVSTLIEEKAGTSTETASNIAGNVDRLVDMLDQQLLLDQLTGSNRCAETTALEHKIDRLTEAIDRLNTNLEKIARR